MNSTKSKPGRKAKPHKCSWNGDTIDGLYKCPDGRWKVCATGFRYTEPDERLAVARFKRITGGKTVMLTAAFKDAGVNHQIKVPTEGTSRERMAAAAWSAWEATEVCPNSTATFSIDTPPGDWQLKMLAYEPLIWAWVREQLISSPKRVAAMVGIEQLGWLKDLKPPEKLPSPSELETIWTTHTKCTGDQRQKVLRGWQDFVRVTKIESLDDITPKLVIKYQDDVDVRIVTRTDGTRVPISGKQQAHLYGGIRRLLSFARERGDAVETIGKVLAYLAILKPSRPTKALLPTPIEVDDFQRLIRDADPTNLAMILLMLNGAFYLGEVVRLEWADVKNGCIITNRAKTGEQLRVCVLWPETIRALEVLPRTGPWIFPAPSGRPITYKGAEKRFQKVAKAAGLKIVASQLRDGAATASVEANVNSDLLNVLLGHASGMSDHYVLRNPKMIAPACVAIREKYMVTSSRPTRSGIAPSATDS